MSKSAYVSYNKDQLNASGAADESVIFPLLRFDEVDPQKLTWGFAVPRRRTDGGGESEERRKNMLAAATLQAIGFEIDPNNPNGGELDFFYFKNDGNSPIDSIASAVFKAFPDFPTGMADGELRVVEPTDPLEVKAKSIFKVKEGQNFLVDGFIFEHGESVSFFSLGAAEGTAVPEFRLSVALNIDSASTHFPPQSIPKFTLENFGVENKLFVNAQKVVPNNTQPLTTVKVPNDTRHDRLTSPVVTMVCLAATDDPKPFEKSSLAIEVFPAISIQPNENLPINVTLAQDSLRVRHFPTNDKFGGRPRLKINHLKPCLKVTVQGPTVHAEPSSGNLSEFLPLLEPAERKFDQTVESINDFMTYSFEVSAPLDLGKVAIPELDRLEQFQLSFPQAEWWKLKSLDLFKLLLKFIEHPISFQIPNFEVDTGKLKLNLPGFGSLPNLPPIESLGCWHLRVHFKDLAKPTIDLALTSVKLSADFLILEVPNLPDLGSVKFFDLRIQPLDFNFNLPDLGLPSLLDFGMPKIMGIPLPILDVQPEAPGPITWEIKFKLPSLVRVDFEWHKLFSLRLRRPDGMSLALPIVEIPTVNGFDVSVKVKVEIACDFPRVGIDQIELAWNFGFDSLVVELEKPPILKLKNPLQDLYLPKIPGKQEIDCRMLKLRIRTPEFDLGCLPVLKLELADLATITLDFEVRDQNLFKKNFEFILNHPEVSIDVSVDLDFPLTRCSLTDLLGNFPAVSFRLSLPEIPQLTNLLNGPELKALRPLRGWSLPEIGNIFGSLSTPIIPFELIVRLPNPSLDVPDWSELKLVLGFKFDLQKLKLLGNRIYFFLPQIREPGKAPAPRQVIDFDIFTLTFPARPPQPGLPTENNHDGYLDLTNREFVIDLIYAEPPQPPPRIYTYFPGGMDPEAARLGRDKIEELPESETTEKEKKKKLRREYTKRFQLELDPIDPALWPEPGPHPLMFRLNGKGLTLSATLSKTEVVVDDEGFDDDGKMNTTGNASNGLLKQFKFDPQESRGELRSRLVIIDNELREAGVYAKAEVPGCDDLIAQVSVVLRQSARGKLPEVLASMELERADSSPLAEFSIKLLEMTLDRIALGLIWRLEEKDWDYTVIADGTVAFTGAASLVDDLEGLRAPKIKLINLDLRRMNLREMRIPIDLVEPIRFDILDGMFGVELGDLELSWTFDGKIPKPRLLACELAKLEFKNPGALEVAITVGGLHIEFDPDLRAHVKLPSSLGIEVALGPTVRFAGRVGWVENEFERYLFASGKVMLEGMPEISGLLKFGTGVKTSGTPQINLVLYGEVELDEQLYPGVVVKRLGLGLGLNNQLAALPPKPSADAIIKRINTIKPGELEGWKFVREGGFYLSIVGSVTLASNPGDAKVLNAYVAQLIVSFDTNFDLVAAGKVWLSTSLAGQLSHPDNPAFVGAMVLSPRQQKLELVLESRQDAYVEKNDLIKKLLSKSRVRFEFRLTPQLVDFHLAEVSYRDNMFGVDMLFFGEYRIAIFKRAVLLKSLLSATGHIERSMTAGPGGFDLRGDANLSIFYGGLLTDSGAMAYAGIDASISFSVSAFIEIEFSKSFKVCGKRISISWSIVFRQSAPRLELTFRGHIAVADQGGFIGVDVQIGINMSICGYRLRASGRLAINPELYDEVRSRVAAFESDLDAAVKKLDQSSEKSNVVATSVVAHSVVESQPESFSLGEDLPTGGEAIGSSPVDAPGTSLIETAELDAAHAFTKPTSPERWIHYRRKLETGSLGVSLLLPSEDAPWLTPQMSTLHGIEIVSNDEAKLIAKNIWLKKDDVIRIFGARGHVKDQQVNLDVLNGERKVLADSDGESVIIDIEGLNLKPAGPDKITVFGGMWFSPASRPLLNPADQDGVFYQQEVERVAVVTGIWKEITEDASVNEQETQATLKVESLGVNTGDRVLLCNKHKETVDYGWERLFTIEDRPELTLQVISATTNQIVVSIPPSAVKNLPKEGWWIVRSLELAPTWSDRNRLNLFDLRAKSKPEEAKTEYLKLTQGATSWAGTAGNAGREFAPLNRAAFQVVFDRRLEQEDPRFTVEPDGFVNPPGVLSARLRDIESVEVVGADQILASSARYEEARRDLTRQELHEALDLNEDDTLHQARAQSAQLLLHRLSKGSEPEDSIEAKVVDFTKQTEFDPNNMGLQFGWLWKTEKDVLKEVHVRRAGEQARKIEITSPTSDEVKIPLATLHPRQDFVLDETASTRERGRVIVKLPLRFDDSFLRNKLEHLGQLQIYRRIGNTPSELIADFIRPEVSLLTKDHDYSAENGVFVPSVPNMSVEGITKFTGEHRNAGEGKWVFEFAKSSTGKFDSKVLIKSLCKNVANEENAVISDCVINSEKCSLVLEAPISDPNVTTTITCVIKSPGLIIPSPYVFSDEFAVEDRQFADRTLVSRGFENGRTQVTYGVRVLGEGDSGGPAADLSKDFSEGKYFEWKAVPVYIPPRRELPRNLAIAIDVHCLASESSADEVKFQLVSTVGDAPSLAIRDGRELDPKDYEIWVSATQLRQSGFYAADTTRLVADSNAKDNSNLQLDDIENNPLAESIDGKQRLAVNGSNGAFHFTRDQLATGSSYRVHLRFLEEGATPLLVELPVLLVRELPPQWNSEVRFRRVEAMEVVPDDHVKNFINSTSLAVPEGAFSADDLYSEGRATIRMTWESQTVLDGGVELQFRDFDDSSLTGRVLCEVLEADEFQTAYGDFSDATQWRLRHRLNRERFASAIPAQSSKIDDFSPYYVLHDKDKLAPPIQELKERAKELSDLLLKEGDKEPKSLSDINWNTVAESAEIMHAALLLFEKSPLNFELLQVKEQIALTRKVLRALIVGQKLFDSDSDLSKFDDLLNEASRKESVLFKLLEKIDQPVSVSDGLSEAAVFLDRETSKRLAGIIRRRQAIANDVATLQFVDSHSPSKNLTKAEMEEPLSRESMFRLTIEDANSIATAQNLNLTLTNQLKDLIIDVSQPEIFQKNFQKNIELWKKLWFFSDKENPLVIQTIVKDEEFTKRITRAAALTDFFGKLEDELKVRETDSFAAVLKRPHHELTTFKSDVGVKPKPIPLRSLLPADVRRVETGKLPPLPDYTTVRQPDRMGRLAVLDSNGMVFIWSSLGADLAQSAMKLLHQFTVIKGTGPFQLGEVAIDLEELTSGPVLLVRDRETIDLWDAVSAKFIRRVGKGDTKYSVARFARTPRGVEVLAINKEENKPIELHSLEARKQTFSLSERALSEDPRTFNAACYDDDSATLAATDTKNMLHIWRDMGRSENSTPFISSSHGFESITQIESVTLPGGLRFVLLGKAGDKHLIKLFDSENSEGKLFAELVNKTKEIKSIAIDRRELTMAVAFDDSVAVYDLLSNDFYSVASATGSVVSMLHSHHQSYVISKNSSDGLICACVRDEKVSPVQDIPVPNAIALVSKLQMARTSNASKDLVSLFHLWQRMGFCLDFAAQDARGELIDSGELADMSHSILQKKMRNGKGEIRTNGKLHHAYFLQAEEHDAEFQPGDRVGLAFASIALVPKEFCDSALYFNVEFLKGTIKDSAILFKVGELRSEESDLTFVVLSGKQTGEMAIGLSGPDGLNSKLKSENYPQGTEIEIAVYRNDSDLPLREWLKQRSLTLPVSIAEQVIELAHVTHLIRLAGLPIDLQIGELIDEIPMLRRERVHALGDLAVQPVAERFLSVPASAGRSHAVWSLPDFKGHRILAATRRVSRYEPLLRWLKSDNARRDLPADRMLTGGDIKSVDMKNGTITLDKKLSPKPLGRLPLVMEIISGDAAGQRRIVNYDGDKTLTFDITDPWLKALPTGVNSNSKYRIIDRSAGWRLVSIDPFHDPARGEGAQSLMVYQYPHSRIPRFSFQLPLDGMRSIYNQISRVRTGFNGVETVFRYFLADRCIDPDRPNLLDIMSVVVKMGDQGTPPEMHTTTVPRGRELNVKLFRHERLVSLPELPYFYRYRVDVRSAYSSRLLEHDRVTVADLIPDDVVASPPAERFPAVLGMGRTIVDTVPFLMEGSLPANPGDKSKVKLGIAKDPLVLATPCAVFLQVKKSSGELLPPVRVKSYADGEVSLAGELLEVPLEGWGFTLFPKMIPLTLPISAHRDHSTLNELKNDPRPNGLDLEFIADDEPGAQKLKIFAMDLPDLLTDYGLFYRQSPDPTEPSDQTKPLSLHKHQFIATGWIRMPWSPEFKPSAGIPTTMPLVVMSAGLVVASEATAIEVETTKVTNSVSLKTLEAWNLLSKHYGDAWPNTAGDAGKIDILEMRPLNGSLKYGPDEKEAPQGKWTTVAATTAEIVNLKIKGTSKHSKLAIQVRAKRGTDIVLASSAVLSVPLHHYHPDLSSWQLSLNIVSPAESDSFNDPSRFFVQALRLGTPTRAVPVQISNK
ncbi:MAG: hypothetical protein JNK90_03300 [Planctomycetaceae bacterium]|nr:hypothetical protein [Planctomycetaceae bacterium]